LHGYLIMLVQAPQWSIFNFELLLCVLCAEVLEYLKRINLLQIMWYLLEVSNINVPVVIVSI